jgi:hypothetical protein
MRELGSGGLLRQATLQTEAVNTPRMAASVEEERGAYNIRSKATQEQNYTDMSLTAN